MNKTAILKADLLDIIFENRNKDYGAYTLRKYYHERLYKALGITFLLVSLLCLYSLLHKAGVVLKNPFIENVRIVSIPRTPIKEKILLPVKPKSPVTQKELNSQIFTSIIKVADSTDQSIKPLKDLDSVVISTVTNTDRGDNKQIVKAAVNKEMPGDNTNEVIKPIDKNKVIANPEIPPSYPGGTDALINFLQRNLHNPQELEEDQAVSVKIKFIVGYDGILKGFETVEDGGAAFNNEVIRVLKKMPAWIAGRSAGENVSVYYTIPVKFVPQR